MSPIRGQPDLDRPPLLMLSGQNISVRSTERVWAVGRDGWGPRAIRNNQGPGTESPLGHLSSCRPLGIETFTSKFEQRPRLA